MSDDTSIPLPQMAALLDALGRTPRAESLRREIEVLMHAARLPKGVSLVLPPSQTPFVRIVIEPDDGEPDGVTGGAARTCPHCGERLP